MPRPATSQAIRNAALLRDRGLCCNCSQPADHVHHIVPLHLGGQDALGNMVAICTACHGLLHGCSFGLNHRAASTAGQQRARAAGKPIGRPRSYTPEQAAMALQLREDGTSLRDIGKKLGLSLGTVQRILEA